MMILSFENLSSGENRAAEIHLVRLWRRGFTEHTWMGRDGWTTRRISLGHGVHSLTIAIQVVHEVHCVAGKSLGTIDGKTCFKGRILWFEQTSPDVAPCQNNKLLIWWSVTEIFSSNSPFFLLLQLDTILTTITMPTSGKWQSELMIYPFNSITQIGKSCWTKKTEWLLKDSLPKLPLWRV